MSLRRYLYLVGFAGLLPILVALAAVGITNARHEQAEIERGLFLAARTMASAIDLRMSDTLSTLRALAVSEAMTGGNVEQMYVEVQRAAATQPHWKTVSLLTEDASEVIFNTSFPLGTKFERPPFSAYVKVVTTGKPAVSPILFTSIITGDQVTFAAVPVTLPHGKYILSASQARGDLGRILANLAFGQNSNATVFDREGTILARSTREDEFFGRKAAVPEMLEAARLGIERTLSGTNHAGIRTFGVTTPAPLTGWSVGLAIPAGDYSEPIRRNLAIFGAGGLAAVTLGVLGAALLGRRISDGIYSLARTAKNTGRGSGHDEEKSGILELREVAHTLDVSRSEQQKATAQARQSEQRFKDFADAVSDWYWETGPDLRFTGFYGGRNGESSTEALIGKTASDLADPDNLPADWQQHLDDLKQHRPFRDFEYCQVTPAGPRYRRVSGKPLFDDNGAFLGYRGTGSDITREVLAEQKAEQARLHLDQALDAAQTYGRYQQAIAAVGQFSFEPLELSDLLQKTCDVSAKALDVDLCQMLQVEADGVTWRLCAGTGWTPGLVGEARFKAKTPHTGLNLLHTGPIVVANYANETRFEPVPWVRAHGAVSGVSVMLRAKGRSFGIFSVYSRTPRMFDQEDVQFCEAISYLVSTILVRRDDEFRLRQLAEENAQFAAAVQAMGSGVVITDSEQPDNPIVFVNPAFTTITGYAAHEAVGRNCRFLQGAQTDSATVQLLREAIAAKRSTSVTLLNYRKDGEEFHNELIVSPIAFGSERPRYFVGIQNDVTAQRNTEQQMRQVQKMEAMGQLTGGIAHDFNNLLTVIVGNSGTLAEKLVDDELLQQAKLIQMAGDRAADLTRRLLTFARSQPLLPERLDVNFLISETENLLRITIGEHIVIEKALAAVSPTILADRTQIETAILNLAVNARDAMPDGGTLKIATSSMVFDAQALAGQPDCQPGQYAMISVSDNGTGMPPAVVARVLEPFFTTKEVGKGTGLGLSMVYGFVSQSGGFIEIDSVVGRGTDVRIYLPEVAHTVAARPDLRASPSGSKGTEKILVVEDDELVADHVVRQLTTLGYKVSRAADAKSALAILAADSSVDLLFTDIVMPGGMNGMQLAEEARRLHPRILILLTSGYIDADGGSALLSQGVQLLRKPYQRTELADAIRNVLDRAD